MDNTECLGITLTSNMSWDTHVENITTKANQDRTHKAHVRPLLEHGRYVWDPHSIKNIQAPGTVQREAARWVQHRYRQTSSVDRMIQTLDWPSLLGTQRKIQAVVSTNFTIKSSP